MPSPKRVTEQFAFLGIDPGASGGLALLEPDGTLRLSPMPDSETGVWHLVTGWVDQWYPKVFGVIEQVQGYIGTAHPGATMFKFGMGYGGLRMALVASECPFAAVRPEKWQKALGVPSRGRTEPKPEFKRRLKERSHQLFPKQRTDLTLKTCDAALLAEYARRFSVGGKL